MEKDRLKHIVEFAFQNNEENDENEIKQSVKDILKLLIVVNAKSIEELWFENAVIKQDVNYYNLIIDLIDKLYVNLTENKIIDIKKTSIEMVEIINKSEYCSIYELIRKLFFKVDPTYNDYYDIYCSVCFLGFNEYSRLNYLLIENLKELKEYDTIINSPFSQELSNFNYGNLDREFLENLNEFIDSIMAIPPDNQKINEIIEKLKNYKGKSNNIQLTLNNNSNEFPSIENNIQNKNGNDDDHKNIQEQSKNMNDDKSSNNYAMDIPKIDNDIHLNKLEDNVSTKELNNKIVNNDQAENKIKEANNNILDDMKDNIPLQEVNFANIGDIKSEEEKGNKCTPEDPNNNSQENIKDKTSENIQNDSLNNNNDKSNESFDNQKSKSQTISPVKSNGEEFTNNEDTEITSNKRLEKETEYDTFENFKNASKIQCKEITNIEKIILMHKKRMYRVNAIISLKEKIKQWMNKFCDISKSLKELLNHFCTFQENMINITVLKSIINQMKPPVISNIRRKFIDLFIFWIIKKNEKLFVLDPNYSPKSNYLDQILEILQNKNNSNEVKSKIDFVLKEKGKNSSITRFPMKIKNYLIDDCISYLNFYKGKCSQVIHIGKEGFKFYNLPEITKNDKINDTYHIFSESKNKKDYTEIKINSNNENIAEKDSMIDIEFVLKFLFESNYAYKPDDTNILNILSNINNEKKDTFDTIIDSISQSFSNAVKSLENNSNMKKRILWRINYLIKKNKNT